MTLMFTLSLVFAIANIENWKVSYSYSAGLITISGILIFIFAETFVNAVFQTKGLSISKVHEPKITINNSRLFCLLIFNIIVILWYFFKIRSIVGGGDSISTMFLYYRRLGIENLRGKEVETVGGIIQQLLKIVEGSGYVGGYLLLRNYLYHIKSRMTSLLLFSLIILSILPSSFGAGRTQILKLLSSFVIFYYILWHQKNGWHKNLSLKILRVCLGGIIIGIPSFYYSLSLLGRSTNRTLFDYVSDYIASGILLFSDYLNSPVPRTLFGEESLYNLLKFLNFLGLTQQSQTYNLEFRRIGVGYSNIYTFFRRPLHDFGLFGMYLFVAIIAMFFAYMYFIKIKNKPLSISTTRWTLIYGYFYYWIVSSSIIQYSAAYISMGTILNLIAILVLYHFLTATPSRIRIRWK